MWLGSTPDVWPQTQMVCRIPSAWYLTPVRKMPSRCRPMVGEMETSAETSLFLHPCPCTSNISLGQ